MADTNSSAKTPTSGAAPRQTAGPSLGQRVVGLFRTPGTAGAPGQPRKTSPTTRFIVGSITFVLVAELLTYLIDFANVKFKLNLTQPIFGPSASWLSWFFLINVVLILGLWILLNRMGFFPRDMWSASRTSGTRGGPAGRAGAGSSTSNGKSANQIPGIGKARTRAERRHSATAKAISAANSKSRAAASSARSTTPEPEYVSGEHDDAYERAKAAQRLRKRRALR